MLAIAARARSRSGRQSDFIRARPKKVATSAKLAHGEKDRSSTMCGCISPQRIACTAWSPRVGLLRGRKFRYVAVIDWNHSFSSRSTAFGSYQSQPASAAVH